MELKKYRLGDIGEIITGKTPSTSKLDNFGGVVPFLTPSDDLSSVYIHHTAKTLSAQGIASVKNCLLPPMSVCISCIGSDLGRIILTSSPTVTNQQFNSIIPSDNFDSEFLYYYLSTLKPFFKKLGSSSTSVPIINKTQFSDIIVSLPRDIQKIAN